VCEKKNRRPKSPEELPGRRGGAVGVCRKKGSVKKEKKKPYCGEGIENEGASLKPAADVLKVRFEGEGIMSRRKRRARLPETKHRSRLGKSRRKKK